MQFTKEELYTIERTMDNLVAEHLKGVAQQINILSKYDRGKELLDKMFKEWVESYDLFKTIITKCERERR